jgi:aarF domain-containing kinase
VREALVCAVALLLFDRDIAGVTALFSELMLLPEGELASKQTRDELEAALTSLADRVLVVPNEDCGPADEPVPPPLPSLRFDALIAELAILAPRFALTLPPYFLNNARALATLEGMARSADPRFDVIQAVYPFALRRLLADPRNSPRLRATLRELTRGADGAIDLPRVRRLLDEAARLSGRPRRQLALEAARTPGGRALAWDVARALLSRVWSRVRGRE